MDVGVPSDVQWDALIEYITPDPEMLNGILVNPTGKARLARKWESLAVIVNAVDRASAQKSGKGWKNAWNGVKGRARKVYREKVAPTWAPGMPLPDPYKVEGMSDHYRRVVALTGTEAAMASLIKLPQVLHEDAEPDIPEVGQAPEGAAVAIDALAPIAPAAVIAPVGQAAPILDDDAAIAPFGQEAVGQAADEAIIAQVGQAADEAIIAQVGQAAENINPSQIIKGNIFANDDLEWEPFQFGNEIIIVEDLPSDQEIYGEVQGAAAPLVKHEFKYQVPKDEEVEVITLSDTPIKQSLSHTPPRGSGLTPANKRRMSTAAIPRHNTAAVSSTSVKVEKDFEMLTDNPHWPVPQRSKKLLYSEREQVAAVGHPSIKEQLRAIVLGNTMLMRGLIGVVSAMKIE